MHYYSFNVGDYRRDTVHLSRLEHSIYRELIDEYYLNEKPIPVGTQWVIRHLRLITEEEQKIAHEILQEFFTLTQDGWRHDRIDQDIRDYQHMVDKNRKNGKLGGRPPKTQSVISGLRLANPNESQPRTINHKPRINTSVSHEKIMFDGKQFKNINGELQAWKDAYPAVNVELEISKAAAWLISNPANKKTQYARFLNSWLSRAQDKAPRVQIQTKQKEIIV